MRDKPTYLLFCLSLFFVNGCNSAINKTLSPPSETNWVNVEIKNPSPYTRPFPLEVRYISHQCLKKRVSGFDGSVITEPSYNVIQIPMKQQSGDIWKEQIAMTGGGSCQWTLSAVSLGIEYIDATHLGKDLVPGTAVGVTIAFDNDASRNGKYSLTKGNKLDYSPKYYPFIKKWGGQKEPSMMNKLYLLGKNAFLDVRVNIVDKHDFFISYSPVIDESKMVEMIFPYEKKDGEAYIFVYPDGEKISSRDIRPDFNKLDNMIGK